ncbi:MAG TPA: hypothetical protein VGX69_06100 [Solirubrobacteraceae bacterium]|nr:hypothetical protein [Solirubrobacteraceae bacterium]
MTLDADAHRRAKRRASEFGISFAEYVRRAIDRDLGDEPRTDISEIFGIFDSGVSDVASNVDKYLGEAAWREHLRETGQSDR